MKLYFQNSGGEERLIAEPKTKEDASNHITQFLEEHNYKSYYTMGSIYEDKIVFDVGSWSEFFILYL